MQNLPHYYSVAATSTPAGNVDLASPGLVSMTSDAPAEFGGPGDLWSPETLLTAAVADCFILSFRAIARASKFEWMSLNCDVEGVLERLEKVTRFSRFNLRVVLVVPAGTDEQKAMRILEKSEHACLVTNSMTSEVNFSPEIRVAE
ncbi:MAG: OsmC family protein [Gammaproteobacteria bacterium]|nr:OsmC family protein [Gammaproteobacteria bacterium]